MNKAELIEALTARLGDKKQAVAALDAVLTEIQSVVTRGDKVAITGFGVFEKRVRAARTARNPRTGEPVKVKKTSVPAFRAGATFRDMVAANGKAAKKSAISTGGRAAARSATKAAASTAKGGKAVTKTAASKAEAPKAATAKAPAKSAAKAAKTTGRGAAKSTAKATKATAGRR